MISGCCFDFERFLIYFSLPTDAWSVHPRNPPKLYLSRAGSTHLDGNDPAEGQTSEYRLYQRKQRPWATPSFELYCRYVVKTTTKNAKEKRSHREYAAEKKHPGATVEEGRSEEEGKAPRR
jgi:hypothetical protein